MKFANFLRKNGKTPKRVVDFLLERDTFRIKILEIVEDFVCEANFLHFFIFSCFFHFFFALFSIVFFHFSLFFDFLCLRFFPGRGRGEVVGPTFLNLLNVSNLLLVFFYFSFFFFCIFQTTHFPAQNGPRFPKKAGTVFTSKKKRALVPLLSFFF